MTTEPPQPPGRFQATVTEIFDLAADVRCVRAHVAADAEGKAFDFAAGQYAVLNFNGPDIVHETRPYSIASAPHAGYVEFHIRNTGRGLSAHAASGLKRGDVIHLDGPFGKSPLAAEADVSPPAKPLLLLAGGVGIAPVKAVIDSLLSQTPARPVTLYWGAANAGQLYLHKYFNDLAAATPAFTYHPVLVDNSDPACRAGYIGPALTADIGSADLSGHQIYMAGPTPMIDATLPLLLTKGAKKDCIFSDAFQI